MDRKKVRKNKSKATGKAGGAKPVRAPRFGISRPLLAVCGLVFLSLLFVLGHDVMTQGRMFEAKEIAVIGNHRLTEARVLELAGIEPGTNIFAVNLGVARQRLLSDGWLAEARVGREIPDRLVIRVREHEPLALIELKETYVMSREGTIIKQLSGTDDFDLPRVTGLTYADLPLGGDEESVSFGAMMQALRVAQGENGSLALAQLERIDVDPGLGVTLYARGPVKCARIGFSKYEEKYRRVARLMASLDRGADEPALEITDLESDSRIVAGPF